MAISRHRPRLAAQMPGCMCRAREKERLKPRKRSSIFDGEPLPDFVDPLLHGIEPRMQGAVVQIEDIAKAKKAENPVMALDVRQHRLDRMADKGENAQQRVHGTPFPQ